MFKVVIPAGNPDNLVNCVRSIYRQDFVPPENIIAVHDFELTDEIQLSLPGITWVLGEKPFIFSRNSNLGIRKAGADVVLMNDDTTLAVRRGLTRLTEMGKRFGLTSPAIHGVVGNEKQHWKSANGRGLVIEERMLCFVCIFIPKTTWDLVGELDERFVGYGYEDDDYCRRVREAGLKLAIYYDCIIEHGSMPSTWRHDKTIRKDKNISKLMELGKKIYVDKWGSHP